MLNQEKTRPIDTFAPASVPHAKRGSEYDLIYAQDSLVFQSITLSPADVLTIRRENAGLSIEELSKLSGIPTADIACYGKLYLAHRHTISTKTCPCVGL